MKVRKPPWIWRLRSRLTTDDQTSSLVRKVSKGDIPDTDLYFLRSFRIWTSQGANPREMIPMALPRNRCAPAHRFRGTRVDKSIYKRVYNCL